MKKQMQVVIVEPHKRARIASIEPTLEAMQALVDGYIEAIYPWEGAEVCLVCNEDGKLRSLPLSRALYDDEGNLVEVIAGTFFICGLTEDDFDSLTDEQAERFKKEFLEPEEFLMLNGKLIVLPYEGGDAE